MHFKSTNNPTRIWRSVESLKEDQAAALATGNLKEINECFELTWCDDTPTPFDNTTPST